MEILLLIVLAAVAVFMIAKPETFWKLDHMLTVKNGEPTEFAIAMIRVGGILTLVAEFVLVLFLLAMTTG